MRFFLFRFDHFRELYFTFLDDKHPISIISFLKQLFIIIKLLLLQHITKLHDSFPRKIWENFLNKAHLLNNIIHLTRKNILIILRRQRQQVTFLSSYNTSRSLCVKDQSNLTKIPSFLNLIQPFIHANSSFKVVIQALLVIQ